MRVSQRKPSSRASNKENKPKDLNVGKLNHCKIDMAKESVGNISQPNNRMFESKNLTPANNSHKQSL